MTNQAKEQAINGKKRLDKRRLLIFGSIGVAIFCIVAILAYNRFSRSPVHVYRMVAKGLVAEARRAIALREYGAAFRLLQRARYFSDFIKDKNISTEIDALMRKNKHFQKIKAGQIYVKEKWLPKKEATDIFRKAEKSVREIRNLLAEAALATSKENYLKAIASYKAALKRYDSTEWINDPPVARSLIEKELARVKAFDLLSKAQNAWDNGEYERAAVNYEAALSIIAQTDPTEKIFAESLQKTAANLYIKTSARETEKGNFGIAYRLLQKAKNVVKRYSFLSNDARLKLNGQICSYSKRIELRLAENLKLIADEIAKANDEIEFNSLVSRARSLLASIKFDSALKGKAGNTAKSFDFLASMSNNLELETKYKVAAAVLAKAIGILEASQFRDEATVRNYISELQSDLKNLKSKMDQLRKKNQVFLSKLNNLMERANRLRSNGNYEMALKLYDRVIRMAHATEYRNAPQVVEILSKANSSRLKIIEQQYGAKEEKTGTEALLSEISKLRYEAQALAGRGKLAESIALYGKIIRTVESSSSIGNSDISKVLIELKRECAEVYKIYLQRVIEDLWGLLSRGDFYRVSEVPEIAVSCPDITDEHIRLNKQIEWLRRVAQNIQSDFAKGVEKEALPFFKRIYGSETKVRATHIKVGKTVLNASNPMAKCINFRIDAEVDIYVEVQNHFAYHPFDCKVSIKLCENTKTPTYDGIYCQEKRMKRSFGPKPVFFGTPFE